VSGNEEPHNIRSPLVLNCSSDLAVERIWWLNNLGQDLLNNSGEQQLLLTIENVTLSITNTTYTCVVEVNLATGPEILNETITIQVFGNYCCYEKIDL
jgi:hypothetical protein